MKKSYFIAATVVLFVAAVSASCQETAAGKKTNIILIMADDLGAECIGCYGGTSYETPHLDKLAKTGLRFAHGYSQPLCTPSRVQIMTGQYNHRNYIGFGKMDPNLITFANILRMAGYATCMVGKWQLAGDRDQPYRFGFDEYCLWQIDGRDERYWNPRIIENKKLREDVKDKYGPDVFCDYLLDFVERKKNGPFFVYYPMCLPHSPHLPTPDSKGSPPKMKNNNKFFKDMVEYTDTIVGRIVQKLDDLKIRENTLVIFTGDNGTNRRITSQTVRGPVRGGKGIMTNAGTHVPLIASWPGTAPRGKVCDDLIDFSDFLPTFADLAGAPLPKNQIIDGKSFLPQLRGEKGQPRSWVFCHYWGYGRDKSKAKEFARDQRWKLYNDGSFYDLKNDVLEKNALKKLTPEAKAAHEKLNKVFSIVGSKLKKANVQLKNLVPLKFSGGAPPIAEPAVARKQAEFLTIEIDAGTVPRKLNRASFAVPKKWRSSSAFHLVREDDKKSVPVQLDKGPQPHLLWVLTEPMKVGEKRRYRLYPRALPENGKKPAWVKCRQDDKGVTVHVGSKPVLRYNTAVIPCPLPNKEVYDRSGFVHPVYSPDGQVLTDDFPPDHLHQHGIMFPWTNSTFENRHVDFWNQAKKVGTVEHVKLLEKNDGPVFAQFSAKLRHVDLSAPDGPKAALDETWTIRVYNVNKAFVFDIKSVQTCATKSPLTINKYHYGGMAIRGARDWYKPGPGNFLTSEGKDRSNGNHTRPKWVDIYGTIDGKQSGIAIFCHPQNFRFPQPVRLHPSKPYFSWTPQVLGSFTIMPGKEYTSSYRFVVHSGPPDAKMLNEMWQDYAHPLIATIAD